MDIWVPVAFVAGAVAVEAVGSGVPMFPSFTSGEWIAVIGAIGLVSTNVIAAIKASQKTDTIVAKVVENDKKTDGLINQATEIHTLANNTLTETKSELKQAAQQITSLTDLVSDLKAVIVDLKREREKKFEQDKKE